MVHTSDWAAPTLRQQLLADLSQAPRSLPEKLNKIPLRARTLSQDIRSCVHKTKYLVIRSISQHTLKQLSQRIDSVPTDEVKP